MSADAETVFKCWICWTSKRPSGCLRGADGFEDSGRSVKDVVDFCVPQMNMPDESIICKKCSKRLSVATEFIEKAIYTEQVLRKEDIEANKVKEFGQVIEPDNGEANKAVEDVEEVDDNDDAIQMIDDDNDSEASFIGWETSGPLIDKSVEHDYSVEEHAHKADDGKEQVIEQESKKRKLTLEDVKKLATKPIQLKNLKVCQLKLKCGKCGKVFTSLLEYQNHNEDVKDAPCCDYVQCGVCFVKFTKADYQQHSTEVHKMHVCNECGKCLGSQIALASHLRNVHPKETYECQYCNAPMKTMNSLQNHVRHAHPETTDKELQKFMCDRCPKRYEKKTSLDRHKKWHDNIRDFHCDYCYKSFFTSNELLSHTRLMHSTEETFFCKICGKGFVRSDYLKRHEQYHVKYENSSCSICKKLFRTEAKLMYHMQAGHTEDGESLEEPRGPITSLDSKMKNTGKIPGQYKTKCVCKICKKVIANPFGLRVHYKSHLKLKSFKCSVCGVLLQSPISLKRHEELHKDPNYKFACKICHARKNSEAELEYHENTVHKTKRYKCHLCSEAFGRRYLLDSHQATEHAEEIIKRELILEELSKETMYLDPSDDHNVLYRGPKNNKGTKVGVDDAEINEICEKVQHNEYSYQDMVDEDDEEGAIVTGDLRDGKESQLAANSLIGEELQGHTLQEIRPGEFIALKQEICEDTVQMVQDLGDGEYAIIDSEEQLAQLKTEAGESYAYIATDVEETDFAGGQVVGYVQSDESPDEVREITEEEYHDLVREGKYLVYEDEQGNTVTVENPIGDLDGAEDSMEVEEMEIAREPVKTNADVENMEEKELEDN